MNWKNYSMILLDYNLGLKSENGLDWLKIMLTYPDMPPIIILTNETNTTVTDRALELGAANYLLKTDVNSDNIISKLTELSESTNFHERTSTNASQSEGMLDEKTQILEGGSIENILDEKTQILEGGSIENILDEKTQILEGGSIFNDDQAFQSNGIRLLIPGYTIEREIAKGGMSIVLLARRMEDNLDVILKVLYTQDQEDPNALKRFMQEYNLISAMEHPHVIRIYERAFASDFAYIALEYLPRGDLSKRIEGGIPAEIAMSYLKQITLGLSAIHELNIIHRDLKPGNILFQDENTLKIADFGTAKVISDETEDITLNNIIMGTPYYMSPEQGSGMRVDQRSDIYSLGVLFYQMLTGKKLFTADSIANLIHAHLHATVPKLPENMSKYQPLIEGMLAKEPDERFQVTDELIAGINWIEKS